MKINEKNWMQIIRHKLIDQIFDQFWTLITLITLINLITLISLNKLN